MLPYIAYMDIYGPYDCVNLHLQSSPIWVEPDDETQTGWLRMALKSQIASIATPVVGRLRFSLSDQDQQSGAGGHQVDALAIVRLGEMAFQGFSNPKRQKPI